MCGGLFVAAEQEKKQEKRPVDLDLLQSSHAQRRLPRSSVAKPAVHAIILLLSTLASTAAGVDCCSVLDSSSLPCLLGSGNLLVQWANVVFIRQ